MIDVRNNYKPLHFPETKFSESRQLASPDAQWEGLSLTSDGRVDDCFRKSPLCSERSGKWVDLVDPRVQTFMNTMAQLKAENSAGKGVLSSAERSAQGAKLQSTVNASLEEAGLVGRSSYCEDRSGNFSTAYIGLGDMSSGQDLEVKPTESGFQLELSSIGAGGAHTISAQADNQGRIVRESIVESAEWNVPWLDSRILANNSSDVIGTPHDSRLNSLIEAVQTGQPLSALEKGVLSKVEDKVQTWNVAGQDVVVDYAKGSIRLHNEGFVEPPAGSDFTGYNGKTQVQWQNGQWGYIRR